MTDERTDKLLRPARVAAIDPGSVKAGMVVLQIQPAPPGYVVPDRDAVAILARCTARPPRGQDFAIRMSFLLDAIERWAEDVRRNWQPDRWCVEDPRSIRIGHALRGTGNVVTLGAAFGVACAAFSVAANRCGVDVTLVSAAEWLPKTRRGKNRNLKVNMKHNEARQWLRERWPALRDLTDDEVFASGVAIWAHTGGAMAAIYPT